MPKKILVVCAGNFQRSQALAHYIQEYAIRQSLDLQVKSAGVSVEAIQKYTAKEGTGTPMTDRVIRAQDKLIFKESERQDGLMKPITKELVDEADIIIAAGPDIRDTIIAMFPDSASKIKVAKELVIDKPISRRRANFEDPASEKSGQKYRRGAIKDSLKAGQTFKTNYVMANEARRLAKRIVPKIRGL